MLPHKSHFKSFPHFDHNLVRYWCWRRADVEIEHNVAATFLPGARFRWYLSQEYGKIADCVYQCLGYTAQVNNTFHAILLVPQSRNIKCYSPTGGIWRKKMARELFIGKQNNYLGIAIIVLSILKQLFAEEEVNSGGYLSRWSGSVNIHRYSPPLATFKSTLATRPNLCHE